MSKTVLIAATLLVAGHLGGLAAVALFRRAAHPALIGATGLLTAALFALGMRQLRLARRGRRERSAR